MASKGSSTVSKSSKLEAVLSKISTEIAQAAVEASDAIPTETLAELQQIHSDTSKLIVQMEEVKSAVATSTTQVIAGVNELKATVNTLVPLLKSQVIQAGIQNAGLNAFTFHRTIEKHQSDYILRGNGEVTSTDEVKRILLFFMSGNAKFIEGYVNINSAASNMYVNSTTVVKGSDVAQYREAFHKKLIDQIHELTGFRPVIRAATSDPSKWAIYST
jgi:hypothetical protein